MLHRLLAFVLPRAWADDALGDLREEFLEWRETHGALGASARLVRRSAGLLSYAVVDHARQAAHLGGEVPAAFRRSLRRPALPLAAALTVGPVLGAAGIFGSVLSAAFLGPLPHADPDRLVIVTHEGGDLADARQSQALHARYASGLGSVASLGLFRYAGANVVLPDGARRIQVAVATATALRVVGATAELGRLFRPDDDGGSAPLTALLTHEAWLEGWRADPHVIGRTLDVDGRPREIVGVLSAGIRLPGPAPDLVLSAELHERTPPATAFAWTASVGRLAEGADRRVAAEEVEVVFAEAAADDARLAAVSGPADGIRPRVLSVRRWHARHLLPILAVGFGASVVLLVLTSAAVLLLLLSTADEQERRTRIRRALGATPWRLRAEASVESLAALAGALAVGMVTAAAAVRGLGEAMITVPIEGWMGAADGAVFALLSGLLIVTAAGFFRTGSRGVRRPSGGARRRRPGFGHLLLAAQVAGVVLLVTALIASARSVWTLAQRDIGFDAEGLVTFGVVLPERPYGADPTRSLDFHEAVHRRLAALPGVGAAAYGLGTPVSHPGWAVPWEVQDAPAASPASHHYRTVSRGYFEVLGIPLVAGRPFRCADFAGAPQTVMINEAFARRYWGGAGSALGRRVRPQGDAAWSEVVGVVGNTADHGAALAPAPMLYRPLTSASHPQELRFVQYAVRGPASAEAIAPEVRATFAELDPRVPAFAFETGQGIVRRDVARERLSLVLLAGTALVGLVAASLGLGGVVLLTIARRSREIGVRKALGGRDAELRWRSVGSALRPVLVGIAAGVVLVAAGIRVPAALLHDAGAWGEHVGGALMALLPLLFAAGYLGSRRLVRIEPSQALRE